MAGDLKQFVLEQKCNYKRYRINMDAILKKYDQHFEDDDVIKLSSYQVVKQIGGGNKNLRSFGYSHLETTKRREQSFMKNSCANSITVDGTISPQLDSSGNVTINTATSELEDISVDGSGFNSLTMTRHGSASNLSLADHCEVNVDNHDYESVVSSFLEPVENELTCSDAETLSSFSGDSTESEMSDNYLDYNHIDCMHGEQSKGDNSSSSSNSQTNLHTMQEASLHIEENSDELFGNISKCSIMCLGGLSHSKKPDITISNVDTVIPSWSSDEQILQNVETYEQENCSKTIQKKWKSPKQLFTNLKPGLNKQQQKLEYVTPKKESGLPSDVNKRHCSVSQSGQCGVESARRIKSELVMERLRQYDHTPRKGILSHKSHASDLSGEVNSTYILKSPESMENYVYDRQEMQHSNESDMLDDSPASDSTFLVLSSPKLKLKPLNKSPNKAAYVSHPLRYTKWNGKHSSKSPVKRPAYNSKVVSQPSSTELSFRNGSSSSPSKRLSKVWPSPNGQEYSRIPSEYLHPYVNVELPSPKRKNCYDNRNSSAKDISSQHLTISEQSFSEQFGTSSHSDTVFNKSSLNSLKIGENGRTDHVMLEPDKGLNGELSHKKPMKSSSCDTDNRSSHSSHMDGHTKFNREHEPLSETIEDKVKSWLRTLNASAPFTDPPPLAGCQSPAASPWLRRTGNCVTNFGATLKTPTALHTLCDGRKYTPTKTAPNSHVNLKGKSLLEIFTKLKDRTKTDVKSKRLSPKKDRRRSLPFVRAKRKLKLVSTKNSHKPSSFSIDENSNGIMCTKANLHYDEHDQPDLTFRRNETSPVQKVCIVSPRIQIHGAKSVAESHVSEESSPLKQSPFQEHVTLDMKKYILTTPMKDRTSSVNSNSISEETFLENSDCSTSQKRLVKISSCGQSPSTAMKYMQIRSPSKEDRGLGYRTMEQSIQIIEPKTDINSSTKSTTFNRRLSCSPSVAMGKMQIRTPNSASRSPRKRGLSLQKSSTKSPRQNTLPKSCSNSPRTNTFSPLLKSNSNSPRTNSSSPLPKLCFNSPRKNTLPKACSNSPRTNIFSPLPKSCSNSPRKNTFSPSLFDTEAEITSEKKLASLTQDLFEKCDRYNKYHTFTPKSAHVKQMSTPHNHSGGKTNNLKHSPHCFNGECSVKSGAVRRPCDGRTETFISDMPCPIPGQNLKTIKESLFLKYAIKSNSQGGSQPLPDNRHIHSTPRKFCSKPVIDETISTICHADDEGSDSESEVMTISPT